MSDNTVELLRKLSDACIARDEELFRRIKAERDVAKAALKWALQGHYAVSWDSGFVKARECSHGVEPPPEIDALVREIRREILASSQAMPGDVR